MLKKVMRIISAVCILFMMFTAVPLTSNAAENRITCGEFSFILTADGNAELCQYSGKYSDAAIPNIADGHEVIKILDGAFSDTDIDYVVIPDTITEIGAKAFENCSLYEIRYSGSEADWNKIIGVTGNEYLNDVAINYNVMPVAAWFDERDIEFDGSTLTGRADLEYCYRDCVAVIKVLFYGDVKTEYTQNVQRGAATLEFSMPFLPCKQYYDIEITFVSSLTDMIEYCSVDGEFCTAPDVAQTDGDYEYSVIQIHGVTGADIYRYTGEDSDVVIPETLGGYKVISVSDSAFVYGKRKIEKITLPSTLMRIDYFAFLGLDVQSIFIPASVEIIEEGAFSDCWLADIYVAPENENYCVKDNVLYTKDMTELICYAIQKPDSEFEIPEGVTKIGNAAFTGCRNLKSIKIPDSVTVINSEAFISSGIEDFYISQYVKHIGKYAFLSGITKNIFVNENNPNYSDKDGIYFDKSGKTLIWYPCGRNESCYEIPEGTEIIETRSLSYTRLRSLIIPATMKQINNFANDEDALKTVFYRGTEEDWNDITFDRWFDRPEYNPALKNAEKVFEYNGVPAVSGVMRNCFCDGKTVTANIEFNYIFEDCNVLLAVYDNSGRLAFKKIAQAQKGSQGISLMCPVSSECKDYTAKAFFFNTSNTVKPLGKALTAVVGGEAVLESAHPYGAKSNAVQEYTYDGECTSLSVTFSDDTMTEEDMDYIYIYDKNGTEIGGYTGDELAGQTIIVPGNTVKIRLFVESNRSDFCNYGYRTTSITVNK